MRTPLPATTSKALTAENNSIFQIYLSDAQLELPEGLRGCQDEVRRNFGQYAYRLFNRETLRAFVGSVYGGDVLWAYDQLKPYAYKADLGRYCLLHHFGGWYADVTLKVLAGAPLLPDTKLIYFYDHGNGPTQSGHFCQNGLFYAQKGLPLLADLISTVVRHCRERYIGPTALSPTGPGLFGRLIAQHVPQKGMHHGYFMQLTPHHKQKNRAYIGPKGEIIALHKSAWNPQATEGRLDAFGAKGVNTYTTMWLNKQVYA